MIRAATTLTFETTRSRSSSRRRDSQFVFVVNLVKAARHQHAEANARHVQYALGHDKSHREEQVGCWNKRDDQHRQRYQSRVKSLPPRFLSQSRTDYQSVEEQRKRVAYIHRGQKRNRTHRPVAAQTVREQENFEIEYRQICKCQLPDRWRR